MTCILKVSNEKIKPITQASPPKHVTVAGLATGLLAVWDTPVLPWVECQMARKVDSQVDRRVRQPII